MAQSTGAGNAIADAAKRAADAYRGDDPRPLGGYALVLLVYGGLVAAVTVAAAATGRRLPQQWAAGDLLTVTLGAHKPGHRVGGRAGVRAAVHPAGRRHIHRAGRRGFPAIGLREGAADHAGVRPE